MKKEASVVVVGVRRTGGMSVGASKVPYDTTVPVVASTDAAVASVLDSMLRDAAYFDTHSTSKLKEI